VREIMNGVFVLENPKEIYYPLDHIKMWPDIHTALVLALEELIYNCAMLEAVNYVRTSRKFEE
jgi:hypothetical protein